MTTSGRSDVNTLVGIEAIEIALPLGFLELEDLAEARDVPVDKYLVGLGQHRMAVPTPYEDAVTFGARAADKLINNAGIDPAKIGCLIVATESGVDYAKSVATYIHHLASVGSACRVYEVKQSCFGGMMALQIALDWLRGGSAKGRKALVICTDICNYGLGTPGEPTQGAGAIAMLVSANPKLINFDDAASGNYTRSEHDFWRPVYMEYPLVDGMLSQSCYMEALSGAIRSFIDDNANGRKLFETIIAFAYHTPFPKMVRKAHRSLVDTVPLPWKTEAFEQMAEPGLILPAQTGNLYTASMFVSLISTILNINTNSSYRVGVFSYGSGLAGEFTTCLCQSSARVALEESVKVEFANRKRVSIEEYERLIRERSMMDQRQAVPKFGIPFTYLGVRDHKRIYESR